MMQHMLIVKQYLLRTCWITRPHRTNIGPLPFLQVQYTQNALEIHTYVCERYLVKVITIWSHLCLSLSSYGRNCHSDDLQGNKWALGKILSNPTKYVCTYM